MASALRPGGALIICDDFLSDRAADSAALSNKERRWLRDFQRGWRVNTLMPVGAASDLAEQSGLVLRQSVNLNELLELNRPRDVVIRVLTSLGGRLPIHHPRWLALVGGNALQRCLLNGLVEYRFLVWERV